MRSTDIRKEFSAFFQSKQHKIVRSSSLVPGNDPTLLFTNAGMNQFKDIFLGNTLTDYNRAATCQKVMRAGGKHNDLENVGRTARHHTFFEMLGNFSFGDYFKEDAILLAWEFLTTTLAIDKEKLAISVFKQDDEAYKIWNKTIGIPDDKIAKLDEKDNFWSMGDVGPCGPCSEIHYDLTGENGKTPRQCLEEDDGRFLEIWNLVFMQYEKKSSGEMINLPNPSIDTGMGLERITSVVEGVASNYDSSLFVPLLEGIAGLAKYNYRSDAEKDISCKVIADHLRALSFLIADGVIPGNEGRGYVMKRILRRSARHALSLGAKPGFLAEASGFVVDLMGKSYPELCESADLISKLIKAEETRFSGTLVHGMKHLDELVNNTKQNKTLDGREIFKLYDTFGFPVDLAQDILEDKGLSFDKGKYTEAMEEQRSRARKAQEGTRENKQVAQIYRDILNKHSSLKFSGYDSLESMTSALSFIKDGEEIDRIKKGEEFEILLEDTPFYAEGGGQVGDIGWIEQDDCRIKVTNTFKPFPGMHISKAILISAENDEICVSKLKKIRALVDSDRRKKISIHHTATHLLHNGLRNILGDHVKQAGSHVNDHRLRFDFTHFSPLGKELLKELEEYLNQLILHNFPVKTTEKTLEKAIEDGALAFFSETYGDKVRVVSFGPSVELCGGCHAAATGELGLIKIISEESVASGVRRIEAQVGIDAFRRVTSQIDVLNQISSNLKTPSDLILKRIGDLEEENRSLKKQRKQLHSKEFISQIKSGNIGESFNSGELIIYKADHAEDINDFGNLFLKEAPLNSIGIIYSTRENGIDLMLNVGKNLRECLHAGNLIKDHAELIGGKGGGKPESARCGGKNPSGFQAFCDQIRARLH